jgi:hypothetical protein
MLISGAEPLPAVLEGARVPVGSLVSQLATTATPATSAAIAVRRDGMF